ncbi:MAG: 3'-5' exonuclease [Chlorobiaceae bacterium]|nr:3'-5' exonuclease [Chlorobiaceae bacterium]
MTQPLFKKVLYFDTETTGLEAGTHGIIQLAALMEIGGDVVESFNMKFQPHEGALINPDALKVSGTDPEELKSRTSSTDAYREFLKFLDRHISKFDKTDKAYPAGYNVAFDLQFLDAWFRHHGSQYGSGSYQNWKKLDPLPLLHLWDYQGTIALPDYKLQTVCKAFFIELEAHDALSDILATRALLKALIKC